MIHAAGDTCQALWAAVLHQKTERALMDDMAIDAAPINGKVINTLITDFMTAAAKERHAQEVDTPNIGQSFVNECLAITLRGRILQASA
jgi:hypothetical protein